MQYPSDLYTHNIFRQLIQAFGGYDHTYSCKENEFYEMENLTSDHYPALSPRAPRGIFRVEGLTPNPTALIAKDALCWVQEGKFYINGYAVDMELTEGKKQLVSMGAHVIIFPDKKMINTVTHAWQPLERSWEALLNTPQEKVTFSPCTQDGKKLDVEISATPPSDTAKTWIDTTASPYAMKQYSSATESWVAVATTYTQIEADNIELFAQYDGVQISGVTEEQLQDLNGLHTIWALGDGGSVVVDGLCPGVFEQTGGLRIERKVPDMDFVIESKNRLWGCKYGMVGSRAVNEIYASKLGDPTNWNSFLGISTDSQVISCGTDGPFTGAIAMDTPLFFKEDHLHRIYGDGQPFGMQITACRGVQAGCHKSMAIVGETLLYKSRSGVMAYDGSLPTEVSQPLGKEAYHSAVAGSMGNKYYISMRDGAGVSHLFVFDMAKGLWHREDDLQVSQFCANDGELYAISHGKIVTMLGSSGQSDQPVRWSARTGRIGVEDPDQKYLSRLTLRLQMAPGARMRIAICYDGSGSWEQVAELTGKGQRSFTVPIRPRRCDTLQLQLEGVGEAKLFSILKTLEQGSELV